MNLSNDHEGHPLTVTIDGPAGAGKSSASKALASKLGIPFVDTGSFYRMAALSVMNQIGVEKARQCEPSEILTLIFPVKMERKNDKAWLDDQEVEAQIRTDAVSVIASEVIANKPLIRAHIIERQRKAIGLTGGVVEGRDAGTAIVANPTVRIWLDADVTERAVRRANQLFESPSEQDITGQVQSLRQRDEVDTAQLVRHPEAHIIDTTALTFEEVIDAMYQLVQNVVQ